MQQMKPEEQTKRPADAVKHPVPQFFMIGISLHAADEASGTQSQNTH